MKKKLMFLLCSGGMVLSLSTSIWTLANPTPAKALMSEACGSTSCWNGTGAGCKTCCTKACPTCDGNWCGS